jgi:hypothetical protein
MIMSSTFSPRRTLEPLTARRRRAILAALLSVCALLAGALTAAPARADTYGYGLVTAPVQVGPNLYTCLDDWNGAQVAQATVTSYPCDTNDSAQYWAYDYTTENLHLATPGGTVLNLCLDVYKAAAYDGAPITLWPCDSNDPAEKWNSTAGNGFYNPHSGKCLDIPDWRVTPWGGPPIPLEIWTCKIPYETNQIWKFSPWHWL